MPSEKRIPVKNKETGATVYKTPDLVSRKPELYQKLPQEYDRNPKGRPHTPKLPGNDRLPGPPRLVRVQKPQPPQKPKGPLPPVPTVKVIEPPQPPLRDTLGAILRIARSVQGGELTKTVLDRWKRLLSTASKTQISSSASYWPSDLEVVFDALNTIQRDFNDLVPNERARESFDARLADIRKDYTFSLSRLQEVRTAITELDGRWGESPQAHLKWYLLSAMEEKIRKASPTVEHMLTTHWEIDKAALNRLVSKLVKAANPEDLKAFSNDYYSQRASFLSRTKALELAQKCAKKSKDGTETPLEWLDWTLKVLRANYTQEGQQGHLQEFSISGVKVIIDDRTVTDTQVELYVKHFQNAYRALKAKGFEKAWYGNIFIQCQDCGGVNPNTGGGTGGDYRIHKDTVQIYSRPTPFVVELLVHELGHRYWFKSMSQPQRAKYEDLVKVYTKPRPVLPPKVQLVPSAEVDHVSALLQKEVDLASVKVLEDSNYITQFIQDSRAVVFDFQSKYNLPTEPSNDSVIDRWEGRLFDHMSLNTLESTWGSKALSLLESYRNVLTAKVRQMVLRRNKDFDAYEDSFSKNPAPVVPVSDYGKSNIDEAFAEAFMHYVLDRDMSNDQRESFRQVLKKQANSLQGIARVSEVSGR